MNLQSVITFSVFLGLATGSFAQDEAERKPLFGETHIHTAYSLDAYMFSTRATPDDAYEFAKGKPLRHPLGETYQLKRPLDFMAVTDHGFYMGSMMKMNDPSHRLSKHPLAELVNDPNPAVRASAFLAMRSGKANGKSFDRASLSDAAVQQETWEKVIESANRHYDPGTFTTFIGYEYSSNVRNRTLHRNVLFRGDTAPLPFTRLDSLNPEDLWDWMDKIRVEGHEALAIPHNSNKADGMTFERETFDDESLTKAYADQRMRNEPLVEVTQVKGTSETHPMLSPNDEFADFELVETLASTGIKGKNVAGSYARDAYRTGLEFQDAEGFNPYRFGLIGASDSHTGIVPVNEYDYSGKIGAVDGSPKARLNGRPDQKDFGASGLAGVWAEENTRESIYEAMRRKETWATTGPRIKVRFFGGFNMNDATPGNEDWVEAAYANGVSMGGALKAADANGSPTFAVWAIKDPESGNLDRVQIVKGWSENGESQEKVYNVLWSGDRAIDPATGKLPTIGNTVDLKTATYTNKIGAVELMGTWTDPDFNAEQNAFYYVRVLEIPTPRWNLYDEVKLGQSFPDDLPKTIQERAYTSPIWYDRSSLVSAKATDEMMIAYLDRTEEQTKLQRKDALQDSRLICMQAPKP